MMSINSAPVRMVAQIAGAIGGAALVHSLMGATVVVTTSWLVIVLAWLVWLAMLALGAVAGAYVTGAALTHADKLGNLTGRISGFFSSKAA